MKIYVNLYKEITPPGFAFKAMPFSTYGYKPHGREYVVTELDEDLYIRVEAATKEYNLCQDMLLQAWERENDS